jgi:hypothetical protein
VYFWRVTLMAAGLSLMLLATSLSGYTFAAPRLSLFGILTCRAIGFSGWTVGHDLGLASDREPGAVVAVTLQLHMPAAVWAAAVLLAQVVIEVT